MRPEAADAILDGALWLIAAILVWRTTRSMKKLSSLEIKEEDKAATGFAFFTVLVLWAVSIGYCLWNFRPVFKALLVL